MDSSKEELDHKASSLISTVEQRKNIISDVYMNKTINCSITHKLFALAACHNLMLSGACLVPLASLYSRQRSYLLPPLSFITSIIHPFSVRNTPFRMMGL